MVFIDENRVSWLWPFRRSPCAEKKTLHAEMESLYDIAGAMEMGFARENLMDFSQPLRRSSKLYKFDVERSEDRQHYRLYCDDGEFLLYAQLAQDKRHVYVFPYDPLDKRSNVLFDANKPAFTMTCDETHTEWRLLQEHHKGCSCTWKHVSCGCQRRPEVAYIKQRNEDIGEGTSNQMDVHLAPMRGEACGQHLLTKLPIWNDELDSLVLEFKGRHGHVQASAKNFQLIQEQGGNLVCQYCKIGTNTFSLDFKFPLTVIQAFGISLTTLFQI